MLNGNQKMRSNEPISKTNWQNSSYSISPRMSSLGTISYDGPKSPKRQTSLPKLRQNDNQNALSPRKRGSFIQKSNEHFNKPEWYFYDESKVDTKDMPYNEIRPTFGSEHDFIDMEILDMQKTLQIFRHETLEKFIDISKNQNGITPSYLLRYADELQVEFGQNYNELLKKKNVSKKSDLVYLELIKQFVNYKVEFEKAFFPVEKNANVLFYEHLNKFCCNFYKEKFRLDVLEKNFHPSRERQELTNTLKEILDSVTDYDDVVKEFKERIQEELHLINRNTHKLRNFSNESLSRYLKFRTEYMTLSTMVFSKLENLFKVFKKWTRNDKDFVMNLHIGIEDLDKLKNKKQIEKISAQGELNEVKKLLKKLSKDIEEVCTKHDEMKKYSMKIRDRVNYLNEECGKIKIKMAESKTYMKEFEGMMRKKSSYHMQISDIAEKDMFGAYYKLNKMLESKEDEREKCIRTIENFENTIKESQKQIDKFEKEERDLNEQQENYSEKIRNADLELVQIHSLALHLKKTREMKLSRESSSPIQTELL